jgi:hypothetical protein
MKAFFYAALSLFAASSSIAAEIAPTPKLLARAREINKIEYPDAGSASFEYHFRNLGGHILWCAYGSGGNGHFCEKITKSAVANIDRAVADFCKTAGTDEDTPPHAAYGELWDLSYKCKNGRMSRLPVDMALDGEGYVRSQWKPLP